MNPWQKGYELDYLKDIETAFSDFNAFSCSPFTEMSKNRVAESLAKGNIEFCDNGVIETHIHQHTRRAISVDRCGVILGWKEIGDRIITKISGDVLDKINSYTEPCWLYIWEECDKSKNVANMANFKKIGAKITSFGEIYGVYFKDVPGFFGEREHPKIPEYEKKAVTKLKLEKNYPMEAAIVSIKDKLNTLPEFTKHYSNYNKKGTWSAITLRGYREDPAEVCKPVEMSKKWKEEHPDWETWTLVDTPLREKFPEVETLLKMLPGEKHRIRFMKLAPNDGELKRHTDQVDMDSGLSDGKVARIHFPIVTNDKVEFQNWDWDGNAEPVNMKVGEAWYLDTRKPHRAINGGQDERIHLVIDVEANEDLRKLM